jgi:hypothetical protein
MEDATTSRWHEEANLLLEFLESFAFDRQLVLASSPYLTSQRFYDLCMQYEVRTVAALKNVLGDKYTTELLAKNIQEAILFARQIQTPVHPLVINPTAFTARNWTQRNYLDFWNRVISAKCRTIYFNRNWQFSNSCAHAYLSGLRVGAKHFNHTGNSLSLDAGKKLIRNAIANLEDLGFEVANLQAVFAEIRSFAGLG